MSEQRLKWRERDSRCLGDIDTSNTVLCLWKYNTFSSRKQGPRSYDKLLSYKIPAAFEVDSFIYPHLFSLQILSVYSLSGMGAGGEGVGEALVQEADKSMSPTAPGQRCLGATDRRDMSPFMTFEGSL